MLDVYVLVPMNRGGSWVMDITGNKSNSPARLSDSVVMKWLCGGHNPHGWFPLDFLDKVLPDAL